MDRLTTHEKDRRPYVIGANAQTWGAIYDRLAAYEDTGMTPEEITGAEDRRHACKIECLLREYNKFAKLFSTDGSGAVTDEDINRARELLKADRAGLVVLLPCRLRDDIFVIQAYYNGRKKAGEEVVRAGIDCFHIGESGIPVADICTDDGCWYEAMEPKDYYLSREAAEAELEKSAAENDKGESRHGKKHE